MSSIRSRQAAPPSSPAMTAASSARGHRQDLRARSRSHRRSSRLEALDRRASSPRCDEPGAKAARAVVVAGHRDEEPRAALEVVVDELARDAAGRRDVGHRHRLDAALADRGATPSRGCARARCAGLRSRSFDTCKTRFVLYTCQMLRPGVDRMVWRSAYEPIETGEAHAPRGDRRRSRRDAGDRVGADRRAVGRRDHLRRARGPHRPSGRRALGARPAAGRRAGALGAELARVGDRRPRRDGRRRHGDRREPGRPSSASWPGS